MSLSTRIQRKMLGCLKANSCRCEIELNRLLWSLDDDGLLAACQIAVTNGKPIRSDLVGLQKKLREKWPDPLAVRMSLQDTCQQFPLASRPLLDGGQAEIYVLLDFAQWVNADPEFVLQIMEHIWQKTQEAGDAGYAQMLYKNDEFKYWPETPARNQCCFIAACLATYTQFAPATCRKVFMAGLRSSAGGHYYFKRWSRERTDTGQFAFWGVTEEAMKAALNRQSALSHRIYDGGWS